MSGISDRLYLSKRRKDVRKKRRNDESQYDHVPLDGMQYYLIIMRSVCAIIDEVRDIDSYEERMRHTVYILAGRSLN